MSRSTAQVLADHMVAFGKGIDAIVADYADDAIMITPEATFRGLDGVRSFFSQAFATLPPGFMEAFNVKHQEIVGEYAYILWDALPWVPLGTDTFVIRDGKIVMQTVTMYAAEG